MKKKNNVINSINGNKAFLLIVAIDNYVKTEYITFLKK